jgi:hypothetical protein
MNTTHEDFGEDVFVSQMFAMGVDIVQHAGDLEVGYHFIGVIRHHQCVGLARRLVDVAALFRDPVMFEIVPMPLQHETMHRVGVPVPGRRFRQAAGHGDHG